MDLLAVDVEPLSVLIVVAIIALVVWVVKVL